MKIQYARDDEGPHFCINQNKNIDNDLYCSSNEFPNHLDLLAMVQLKFLCMVNTVKPHIKEPVNFDFRLKCFLCNRYLEKKSDCSGS